MSRLKTKLAMRRQLSLACVSHPDVERDANFDDKLVIEPRPRGFVSMLKYGTSIRP